MAFFTTPAGVATIAALGAFVSGLLGAGISSATVFRTHKEKLKAEADLAERRSIRELELADAKRRLELAERVLTDIYEVRDILMDVRAPFVLAAEMVQKEGDPELVKEASYAPWHRLQQHNEVLARFSSREYEFAALFGQEARAPFNAVRETHRAIRHAVEDMLDIDRSGVLDYDNREIRERERERYKAARRIAFRPSIEERDPLREKLDSAIAEVEQITHAAVASRYKSKTPSA